jgi:hypothetical protein
MARCRGAVEPAQIPALTWASLEREQRNPIEGALYRALGCLPLGRAKRLGGVSGGLQNRATCPKPERGALGQSSVSIALGVDAVPIGALFIG